VGLLPKRWFPLPVQAEQCPAILRYRHEQKRFKIAHAGRRSFKTEILKRTLVANAVGIEGNCLFYGAPTRDQLKRIAWTDLKTLSPRWAIRNISETELCIYYKNGSELWGIGFDKPARFDGKPRWHGGGLDEYADMRKDVWLEHVEPALADTMGWCWFVGVPEGRNHFYELLDQHRQDPDWGEYSWFSDVVMDPREITRIKATTDARTYAQEYQGSFETYEGLAYTYHDRDVHRKEFPLKETLPLILCLDFNLDPCIWLIGQIQPERTYIFSELLQHRTDVWRMCVAMKERLTKILGPERAFKWKIIIYGDYQHGKARSLSAIASSWEIIKGEFKDWNVEIRIKPNPRILDRLNATNSRMRALDGTVRFAYHPQCIELGKDYEMVEKKHLEDREKQGDRTHASSAVDFMHNYEFPVVKPSKWKAA